MLPRPIPLSVHIAIEALTPADRTEAPAMAEAPTAADRAAEGVSASPADFTSVEADAAVALSVMALAIRVVEAFSPAGSRTLRAG